MTGPERVMAVLRGEPYDHRPVALTLSLYGAKMTGADLKRHYTNPSVYAEGQTMVRERFRPDIILGPFALSLHGAAFGGELQWLPDQAPNLKRPPFRSPEEIKRLVPVNDSLDYLIEALRLTAEMNQGTALTAAVTLGPSELPIMLLGLEKWLDTALFDRPEAERILGLTSEWFGDWSNKLFDAGAAFIVAPMVFANPSIINRDILENLVLPAAGRTLERLRGPLIVHHGGARLEPFIAEYAGLPNIGGFVIDPRDAMAAAADLIAPGQVILGNVDGPALATKTAEQVAGEVDEVLSGMGTGKNFIAASSGADIPVETPPGNIDTIIRKIADEHPCQ